MTLDGFPCPAGRDCHLLMIITGRTAGGERIAEPEIILVGRNTIGDVGEGGRTLVGRDDQIGILAIPDDYLVRMHNDIVMNVVGNVEKAANESAIRALPLCEPFIAGTGPG